MSRKNKLYITPPRTSPIENASDETINKICNQLITHGRSKGVNYLERKYNSFKLVEVKHDSSGIFLEYFPKFIEESCDLLCERNIFTKLLEGVVRIRISYHLNVGFPESFIFYRSLPLQDINENNYEETKMDISIGIQKIFIIYYFFMYLEILKDDDNLFDNYLIEGILYLYKI